MLQTEWRPESLRIAQELKRHAEARGMTAGQFALNWVLNNRLVTAVIAGPRTEAQWEDYMGALRHPFTAEDEALVDRLVPTGHPSPRATTIRPTRSRDGCRGRPRDGFDRLVSLLRPPQCPSC
jgi:diketogulonate reductase-like aldo/keto reductase